MGLQSVALYNFWLVTYIQQPSVAKDAEQRVDVTFAGEIQTGPDVASRGHDSSRVSGNESWLS